MKRSSVKVCIRTRPTQYFAQDNIAIDEEHSTIQINNDRGDEMIVAGGPNNKQNLFKFRFDHVFHNATQTTVYDLFARDTVAVSFYASSYIYLLRNLSFWCFLFYLSLS